MPTPPPVSLTNLPYELIITIFTLSSNPSFLFTCKELHHILAPLSRSNSTRINFLLIRYRNNYVKAVIKGLRWKFFDLGLLNALDRLYTRDTQRKAEADARYILHSNAPLTFNGLAWLDTITPADSPSAPCTPEENSTPPASQSREPPKKKRKKYQIPIPESYLQKRTLASSSSRPSSPFPNQLNDSNTTISTDSSDSTAAFNQTIPLPKDFSMPRRLFKSSEYLPLIRELLIRGGSPSYPSHYPLVRASQRGDVDMVRLLLSFGAPPDMRAVQQACVEERDDILDIFLEMGVKPDHQCLSMCVEKSKTRMIDRLLTLGVVPDLKTYPAYASYKAINSRDNTRLTAWLMYWAVMGIFTLVEFVLDTFVFWLPFYYEVKMLFVLWMILPQTQGSIYLYQTWVDPYLSQHEHEIDRTLKDIKKQAMVMGMQYIKQAIQTIQNLTLDIYKKSQNQPLSSQSADSITMSSDRSVPSSAGPPPPSSSPPSAAAGAHGYFTWAFEVMTPKLAAVATMASETIVRQMPTRPLPQPPVNLYGARASSPSSSSIPSSRESSVSSGPADNRNNNNALGIHSTSVSPEEKAQLELLSSRLNHAAQSTALDSGRSLRNRKISLYEDEEEGERNVLSSSVSSATTMHGYGHGQGHFSDNSRGSSSYAGLSRPTGPAPAYTP